MRINGAHVFINDTEMASLKPNPPVPHERKRMPIGDKNDDKDGPIPKGKPGHMVCVFTGSGEAADVPKAPGQVGSGGHGRMVCYVDGKEVFDEPASNVTKKELLYKRQHKDWRSLRNTRGSSMPAPPGTYTMSRLEPSANVHRDVIHLGINSRDGVEIHSMQRGSKFSWARTDGCIRVQEDALVQLGDLLKKHPGTIKIEEGQD